MVKIKGKELVVKSTVYTSIKYDKQGKMTKETFSRNTYFVDGKFASKKQLESLNVKPLYKEVLSDTSASKRLRHYDNSKGLSKGQIENIGKLTGAKEVVSELKKKSAVESFAQIIEERFNLSHSEIQEMKDLLSQMSFEDFQRFYYENTDLCEKVYGESGDETYNKPNNEGNVKEDETLSEEMKKKQEETRETRLKNEYSEVMEKLRAFVSGSSHAIVNESPFITEGRTSYYDYDTGKYYVQRNRDY